MKQFYLMVLMSVLSFSVTADGPVKGEFKDSYLIFSSEDGNYEFKFDGRIMLDLGSVESDLNPNLTADSDFRRLRLAIKTILHKDWAAEFDVDFEGNEVDTKDMWLAYIGKENWNFKIGHHKPNSTHSSSILQKVAH